MGTYYNDRKIAMKHITNWVYSDHKTRSGWSEVVRDIGSMHGFSDKVCLKLLDQASEGKLMIENNKLKHVDDKYLETPIENTK